MGLADYFHSKIKKDFLYAIAAIKLVLFLCGSILSVIFLDKDNIVLWYLGLIEELKRWEDPMFRPESIGEIIGDHNSKYISKGQFKRILFEMAREDKSDE